MYQKKSLIVNMCLDDGIERVKSSFMANRTLENDYICTQMLPPPPTNIRHVCTRHHTLLDLHKQVYNISIASQEYCIDNFLPQANQMLQLD